VIKPQSVHRAQLIQNSENGHKSNATEEMIKRRKKPEGRGGGGGAQPFVSNGKTKEGKKKIGPIVARENPGRGARIGGLEGKFLLEIENYSEVGGKWCAHSAFVVCRGKGIHKKT